MEDPKHNDEAVLLPKIRSKGKGVANVESSSNTPNVVVTTKAISERPKWKKGIAILDFILRLCAAAAAFAATAIMGNTEQTLPFFTQFLQFHAEYNDLPTFTFFVIANAAAGGYLVLSLPFSIVCIVRPHALGPRFFLVILDTVMVTLTISAASAAAAIVYLAHNGNSDANWIAICQQFNDFCQQGSAAVVASFIAAVFFILLVVNSAVALKKTYY